MESFFEENKEIDSEYGIDISEIYSNEVNLFIDKKITHNDLRNCYHFIWEFFMKSKPEPFIEISYEEDAPNKLYAERYLKEITDFSKGTGITFCFIKRDKIYDIEATNIFILKQNVSSLDFEKLFAYSLRTYENSLSRISPFLDFQLVENFDYDYSNFHHFLEVVLTQYDTILSNKVAKFVNKWMLENPVTQATKIKLITPNALDSKSSDASDYDPDWINAAQENIPEQHKIADLKISRLDTMKYFSFFYKTTTTKSGKIIDPIISKEDFISIFKYGIAIPPKQKIKLVKMNLKDVRIGNIEYAIYNFFFLYNKSGKNKKSIMAFFGYYFEQFQEKAATPEALDVWSHNLHNGIKPKNGCILDIPSIPAEE